jgi:hypothetical protein
MDNILKFNTIGEYNAINGHETLHPLVSVVHLNKAEPRQQRRMYFGFYAVFLKQLKCGDLRYGRKYYDYQEGTIVFLAPGQVVGENTDEYYQPSGYALAFHPDLIHGTPLGRTIREYSFFSYMSLCILMLYPVQIITNYSVVVVQIYRGYFSIILRTGIFLIIMHGTTIKKRGLSSPP